MLVAGCNPTSDESANQVISSNEPSDGNIASTQHAVRALPVSEQRALAFATAFGGEGSPVVEVEGERLRYSPGRLVWIGDRAVLLSPGENLDKCHACTGALAIHYLEPAEEGFRVTGIWPALVQGSGSGEPPSDWSLSGDVAEYPVVDRAGGLTATGCTSG